MAQFLRPATQYLVKFHLFMPIRKQTAKHEALGLPSSVLRPATTTRLPPPARPREGECAAPKESGFGPRRRGDEFLIAATMAG